MLHVSHDPEAGTLYVYLTELEEGQATYVLEYPASLLLDAAGQIIGLRLDLDDEITLNQLELALELEHGRLDMETGQLFMALSDELPAQTVALEQPAILDLDDDDRILGIDLAIPAELRSPEALMRLAPLMVTIDTVAQDGDGPVVLFQADEEEPEEEAAEGEGTEEQGDAGAEEAGEQAIRLKSGFVALVGKPNVGKSTLLNALLGEKVAIVSPRPQTTRVPMRGILSRPGAQIIFVDTPGIHTPNHRLGKFMVELAERALPGADVIGFMVDITEPPTSLDRRIAQQVMRARGHKLLLLNKVDARPRDGKNHLEAYRALGNWEMELAISARRSLGLGTLLEEIVARLPEGPPLYPGDQLTDQSEQHMAAEFVREKTLLLTQQEVPHAVAVEVDEWEVKEHATYIRMTINVEREGQKAIVIGAGGAMLKKIGSAARVDIERLLGRSIFLELWVKVRPNWRDDASALGWLGYKAKDWS